MSNFTLKPKVHVVSGVYKRRAIGSKHQLRNPPAWAFLISSIDEAARLGAWIIEVEDRETGTLYSASLDHLRRVGFIFDRGCGAQIALPLSSWTISRRGEIPARQLSLWQQGGS